jgi:hypothetical protein
MSEFLPGRCLFIGCVFCGRPDATFMNAAGSVHD